MTKVMQGVRVLEVAQFDVERIPAVNPDIIYAPPELHAIVSV